MTVIPVAMLSSADLQHLGLDLPPADSSRPCDAMNRSLALHDEQLSEEDIQAIESACTSEHAAA